MKISIETTVKAPLEQVWLCFVTPQHIVGWNFAIDEWCCPRAELDLVDGGTFNYRMEAKDGSIGFDFSGEFIAIRPYQAICYSLGDARQVDIQFSESPQGIRVQQTFEAEDEHSAEQQRQGWLGILQNFKAYVESKNAAS